MTIADIITLIQDTDASFWVLMFFVITTLVEISPVKVNPWKKVVKWMGDIINDSLVEEVKKINTRIDNMDKKVEEIDARLQKHVSESDKRELRASRDSILSFASAIVDGKNFTQEQYCQMLRECDAYELYCEEKHFANSVADESIETIKESYHEHMMNQDFLISPYSRKGARK